MNDNLHKRQSTQTMYRTYKRQSRPRQSEGEYGNAETDETGSDKLIDNETRRSSRAFIQDKLYGAISHPYFDDYTPAQVIVFLKTANLKLLSPLNRKLRQNIKAWREGFLLLNGTDALLDLLGSIGNKRITQLTDVQLVLECVGCIKSLLNSKMGAKYFVGHGHCLKKLIKGM